MVPKDLAIKPDTLLSSIYIYMVKVNIICGHFDNWIINNINAFICTNRFRILLLQCAYTECINILARTQLQNSKCKTIRTWLLCLKAPSLVQVQHFLPALYPPLSYWYTEMTQSEMILIFFFLSCLNLFSKFQHVPSQVDVDSYLCVSLTNYLCYGS